MRNVSSPLIGCLVVGTLSMFVTPSVRAGGPFLIYDAATRTAWSYPPGTVAVYTDLGPLGPLTNERADTLTASSVEQWSAVATSYFDATVAGDFGSIGVGDVDGSNASSVISTYNGGGIHVIYDHDGSVLTEFLGAPPGVLGAGSPEAGTSEGALLESWVVLNGAAIDPADTNGVYFQGAFTHQLGHAINLGHSQVNGAILFFGDDIGPAGCPTPYAGAPTSADLETMYPFLDPAVEGSGADMATVEHPDDVAAVSNLHPVATWPAVAGTATGTVFLADGASPVTGVNVIARNVANPFADAVSAISGDYTQGLTGPDGLYTLNGLTAGADYVLYVDELGEGLFSTPPAQPLPGPEEFWNLAESAHPLNDPPCDVDLLSPMAGAPLVSVDVIFEGVIDPVLDVDPDSLVFVVVAESTDIQSLALANVAEPGAEDLTWSIATEASGPSAAVPTADPPIVTDGGFELGPFGGAWTEYSSSFITPICSAAFCGVGTGTGPHGGSYWCWFGGVAGPEEARVAQTVVLPAGNLELQFYLETSACDSPADYLQVTIDGIEVFRIDGSNAGCGSLGYSLQVLDISAFGDDGSHQLEFHFESFGNGGGASNFFVDDVAIVQQTAPCPWLAATPSSGVIPVGSSNTVDVGVDAAGLAEGDYDCSLVITGNAGGPVRVPVHMTVVPPADLRATLFRAPTCGYQGEVVGDDLLVRIRNDGPADVTSTFTVAAYVSSDRTITTTDTPIAGGQALVAGLAAGQEMTVAMPSGAALPATVAGPVFLGIVVDDSNAVLETDESNNASPGFPMDLGTHPLHCATGVASTGLAEPVSVVVAPDGTMNRLDEAFALNPLPGERPLVVDSTITLVLHDADGHPVVGLPQASVSLVSTLGGLQPCPGAVGADAPSDATGTMTFAGPLFGGGHTHPEDGERTLVRVNGASIADLIYSDARLLACSSTGQMAWLDPATATAETLCTLSSSPREVEFVSGVATTYLLGDAELSRVDLTDSCEVTMVASVPSLDALEYVDRALYAATVTPCDSSVLVLVDPLSGATTEVGTTGVGPVTGLAWDPVARVLRGVVTCSGSSDLVQLDRRTGQAMMIGPLGIEALSLQLAPDGSLLAGGSAADGGNLYRVNPNTAETTWISATGLPDVSGLTVVSKGLDIQFNSGDISGDLTVNLVDVADFVHDIVYGGPFPYRSDFFWSQSFDLRDTSRLSMQLAASCAAASPKAAPRPGLEMGLFLDPVGADRVATLAPGASMHAYVVLTSADASFQVRAWQARVVHSDNVVLGASETGSEGLNLGDDANLVVGLWKTASVEPKHRLTLATIEFRVLDAKPAFLALSDAGSSPAIVTDTKELLNVTPREPERSQVLVNGPSPGANSRLPASPGLHAVPNPLNPSTELRFELAERGRAEVRIFDVSGRLVARIDGGMREAGPGVLRWTGTDGDGIPVSSGVYFSRLWIDGRAAGSTIKLVVLR